MRAWIAACLVVIGPILFGPGARADEQIISFDSKIRIESDGGLDVTETIRVYAEGQEIKRGIYRDFPTTYQDKLGNRYRVAFEFVGATRDGAREPWHIEGQSNGVRIYLGDANVFLPEGYYTYQLHYRTDRQLGFFEHHDELYWNVTGNGWRFPIRSAKATIELPSPITSAQLRASGYTGKQDSTDSQLTSKVVDGGAQYATTMSLWPDEGLTVVLEFPKGVVPEPTMSAKVGWFVDDNFSVVIGVVGLFLLWAFHVVCWRARGRDPDVGPRIPQYEPPEGLSAAAMRFIRSNGYDDTCLAAAVLSLAAKGALSIESGGQDAFTLIRGEDTEAEAWLSADERVLFKSLYATSPNRLSTQRSAATAAVFGGALRAHSAALKNEFDKQYVALNRQTFYAGTGITLMVAVLMGIVHPIEPAVVAVLGVLFTILSLAAFAAFRANANEPFVGFALALFPGIFGLGTLGGMIDAGGPVHAVMVVLLVITNACFFEWMKAPTLEGARLLNSMEGLRWYLGVAEREELDARYRPESTPDRFGRFLPYALALGVEQAWSERFAKALTPAQFEQAQPGWYRSTVTTKGGSSSFVATGFGRNLASSISSASTPPGSSSGSRSSSSRSSSRSSGRSGGGGGGGGGGGW